NAKRRSAYFDFGCCCCCCNCCNCWKICCGVSTPLGDCGLPGTVDGGGALLGAAPGPATGPPPNPEACDGLTALAGASSSEPEANGPGGVAPPPRGVRTNSTGVCVELSRNSILLPVPSSRLARIPAAAPGPTLPKTRWSATPPVIFIPVCRDTSRRIWFRLELSAVIVSWPPE